MDKIPEIYVVDDLLIERSGFTVTKITKSGVVLWPQERHTAGMGTDNQVKAEFAAYEANRSQELHRANDGMIGGNHYQRSDATGTCSKCGSTVQHWDWAHNLRGLEYAATKYIARWRDKGGLESLKKAIHYIQKLVEIHFPGVVVSVNYTNRADIDGLRREGGSQVDGGKSMAGSSATHQTAVNYEGPYSDTF